MGSNLINAWHIDIQTLLPEIKILVITADTDDNEKLKLENVNKYFTEADLLMYSPTIEAGVDYNVEHFDKMYVILCESTSQRSLSQMMGRIRKVRSNEVLMLAFHIKFNETRNFFLFEDIQQNYEYINKDCKEEKTVIINGVECDEEVLTLFDTIYCYNKVEELNKGKYYFIQYLKLFLENKGHIVNLDFKDGLKQEGTGGNKQKHILEAKDLSHVEFLQIKDARIKSSEQKYSIAKYMLKNIHGIDNINELFVKDHYNKETQMFHLMALIDIDNYPLYKNDNRNIEGRKRIEYIKRIINDLGYKHVFDDAVILKDVFNANLEKCYKTNPYFTNTKTTSILFNSIKMNKPKIEVNNKKVLGYLNTVLEGFGVKICFKQVRVKGETNRQTAYTLNIINDLPEFIQYRINRKKEFYDKDGIFKADVNAFKYGHLIAPKQNKQIDYDADDFIDDIEDPFEIPEQKKQNLKPYYDAVNADINERELKDLALKQEEYTDMTLTGLFNSYSRYHMANSIQMSKDEWNDVIKEYENIMLLKPNEQKQELKKVHAKYAIKE
jgi:hypothetical protein